MARVDGNTAAPAETTARTEQETLEQEKLERRGQAHVAEPPKGDKVSLICTGSAPMTNPGTGDEFTNEPSKPVRLDSWLEYQLENNRLAYAPEE